MKWFPFYLMALNVAASSVMALPGGGKTLDNRAGTGRFVFAHLIVALLSPINEVILTMSRLVLFPIGKAPPTGIRTCSVPKPAALTHLH
jgi:hypothetical protein